MKNDEMLCKKHQDPSVSMLVIASGMFANGESLDWPDMETERSLRERGEAQEITIDDWNRLSAETRTKLVVIRLEAAGFPDPRDLVRKDFLLSTLIDVQIGEDIYDLKLTPHAQPTEPS